MKKEKIKPNGRKRIVVIATFLVVAMFLFSIFVPMFNNVSASPTVVKPTIRDNEIDDFEDDTIGNPPSEPFYTYSGDYTIDNDTFDVGGSDLIPTFRDTKSLNLSGSIGDSAEFHFNESDYFSIDFSLLMWHDGGILRFKFQNATDDSFEIDYTSIFNASRYVNAMDVNNDSHVNWLDIVEVYNHILETGAPGWIKADLDFNGVINYLDISYFTGHFVSTDSVEVRYIANIMMDNISYSSNLLLYSYDIPRLGPSVDEAYFLHSYFQFSKDSLGYVGFKCAFRNERSTPSGTWDTSSMNGSSYLVGYSVWDRINISSETDTVAYLDDMTLCYTPYDLAVNSVYPVNTGIDPNAYSGPPWSDVNVSSSFYMIGDTSKTPMFIEANAYMHGMDIPGSSHLVIITSSYDGEVIGKSTNYTNAITASSAIGYDDTATSMYLGQMKSSGNWYIYRDFLVFDTSSIPDDAIIDDAILEIHAKEYPYITNGVPSDSQHKIYTEAYFDNDGIYPRNPIQMVDYNQNKYDVHYSSVIGIRNSLYDYIYLDASCVDVTGMTRCLLRAKMESLSPDITNENNRLLINLSVDRPDLWIQYHVPLYTWAPVAYFDNYPMITNNNTITDVMDGSFLGDYYWYMNITTFGGEFGGKTYSWEFPQTGTAPPGQISPTVIEGKFSYRFQTSAYKEPFVSVWTPAHNAVSQPLETIPNVTINSRYGKMIYVVPYFYNNVTHEWIENGGNYYNDTETVDCVPFINMSYDTDVYWRVELHDYGSSITSYYPNATQNGQFVSGRKAWKFRTEVNTPPYVASYSPAYGSHFNPFVDTIYINMTDNQTDFTFNLFFLQNVLWGNGSYSDELSFIIEDSELVSSPYTIYDSVNGTMNFTWTPSDTANLGYINPMNGTNFSWAVQMDDGVSTSEYPASGRSFATPSNSEIGDWWVNYTSDWLLGNSLPTISVTYPVHAHTYTATQWKNNHNLRVTVIDAEGDDIYLSLSIKSGNGAYSKLFPLQEDYDYFDVMYSDGPIINGTYDFDLSYFVPFDNMNYSYYLTAEDSAHPRGYWNQLNSNFVIGTPPGATNHLSLMSVYPGNGVVDGFSAINNGLTGYYSYYSYSALDADKNHVAFFFSDGVQKETGAGIGYKYNPLLFTYGGKLQYLDDYPWNKFSIKTGLQSRHEYILHIGLLEEITDVIDIGLFGMGPISNFQEFGTGTFELDMLYDDTMVETEFKAELLNLQGTNYIAEPPYRTFELGVEAGEFRFFGASARFSTYPLGSGPNLPGGTWGVNLVRPLSDAGIGFGGLILTLLIVAIFTIIPYYFIRKKAKNVPMPIIFSFGFFGFLLSFGLGFLDLWMFVIPFVIMLFIIIFKALAWIRTGKTEAGVK